ncbi:MAG: hypothetical protein ABJE47_23440 [bacterium]
MIEPSFSPAPPVVVQSPRSADGVVVPGLVAGAICWAAGVGLLAGIGRRSGALLQPINAAAHLVLGVRADGVWGFKTDVTVMGVAVVLVVSAVAGIAAAWLATSRRTLDRAMVAFGVSFAGYLVHVHVVARTSGGLASLLSIGELRALYCSAAIALAVGMRYAFHAAVRES